MTGRPYGGEASTDTVGAWDWGAFVFILLGLCVSSFVMDGVRVASAALCVGEPTVSVGLLLGDNVIAVIDGAFVGNRDGDKVVGATDGGEDGARVGNRMGLDVGLDDEGLTL